MAASGPLKRTHAVQRCSNSAPDAPQGRLGSVGAMADEACESCGDPTDGLLAVHRIYIEAATSEREERITRLDEVEVWCVPCRTIYPHEPAAG